MTSNRFGFDTVFDANGRVLRQSERKGQKKSFTPEEVEAVRAEAFTAGQGSIEARAAQALSRGVGELAGAVMKLLEALDEESEALRRGAATLALAAARKIAGAALDRFPGAEVERLVAECLDAMPHDPRIVVRVAPEVVEALKPRTDALLAERGFAGRLVLVAESALSRADARIEWTDGGLETSADAIADGIANRIASHLAGTAPGTGG